MSWLPAQGHLLPQGQPASPGLLGLSHLATGPCTVWCCFAWGTSAGRRDLCLWKRSHVQTHSQTRSYPCPTHLHTTHTQVQERGCHNTQMCTITQAHAFMPTGPRKSHTEYSHIVFYTRIALSLCHTHTQHNTTR